MRKATTKASAHMPAPSNAANNCSRKSPRKREAVTAALTNAVDRMRPPRGSPEAEAPGPSPRWALPLASEGTLEAGLLEVGVVMAGWRVDFGRAFFGVRASVATLGPLQVDQL